MANYPTLEELTKSINNMVPPCTAPRIGGKTKQRTTVSGCQSANETGKDAYCPSGCEEYEKKHDKFRVKNTGIGEPGCEGSANNTKNNNSCTCPNNPENSTPCNPSPEQSKPTNVIGQALQATPANVPPLENFPNGRDPSQNVLGQRLREWKPPCGNPVQPNINVIGQKICPSGVPQVGEQPEINVMGQRVCPLGARPQGNECGQINVIGQAIKPLVIPPPTSKPCNGDSNKSCFFGPCDISST